MWRRAAGDENHHAASRVAKAASQVALRPKVRKEEKSVDSAESRAIIQVGFFGSFGYRSLSFRQKFPFKPWLLEAGATLALFMAPDHFCQRVAEIFADFPEAITSYIREGTRF